MYVKTINLVCASNKYSGEIGNKIGKKFKLHQMFNRFSKETWPNCLEVRLIGDYEYTFRKSWVITGKNNLRISSVSQNNFPLIRP